MMDHQCFNSNLRTYVTFRPHFIRIYVRCFLIMILTVAIINLPNITRWAILKSRVKEATTSCFKTIMVLTAS